MLVKLIKCDCGHTYQATLPLDNQCCPKCKLRSEAVDPHPGLDKMPLPLHRYDNHYYKLKKRDRKLKKDES